MAGPWYVDDGGDGSAGTSWATAYTSFFDLDAAKVLASNEIVYVGHDHVDGKTHSANYTLTGPADAPPIYIISATTGSSPPTYAKSVTDQIDTAKDGAYSVTFDGAFAIYGLQTNTGATVVFGPDQSESVLVRDSNFILADNGSFNPQAPVRAFMRFENITIDLTADSVARSTGVILPAEGTMTMDGVTFVSPGNRTGAVIGATTLTICFEFCNFDISGFTNGTVCELLDTTSIRSPIVGYNVRTAATWTPFTSGYPGPGGSATLTNCGPADAPSSLIYRDYRGDVVSSTAVTRSGGASFESEACSWLVTTTANCKEGLPLYTPWLYGTTTNGSKNFDVYCTNDTGDFDDSQVWLEVQYLGTADEADFASATDHRTITATASTSPGGVSRDDTTSTWTGGASGFDTYMQRLRVTATVGETGQYRVRVAIGLASIASTRDFWIDPKVTVS